MKCKCAMCGRDNSAKLGRASYARSGIYTSEQKSKGDIKRIERRLRRRRENFDLSF